MTFRTVLKVESRSRPFTLIVEPWAEEFAIAAGERCEVVASHPAAAPTFGVEDPGDGDMIVWVSEGGSTFEFRREGRLEFSMPIAIPW